MDGKLDPSDGVAFDDRKLDQRQTPLRLDRPLIFGLVTLACLVTALTLSAYGHRPALMLPIAIACAVIFVRHGDGRQHWTPASVQQLERSSTH